MKNPRRREYEIHLDWCVWEGCSERMFFPVVEVTFLTMWRKLLDEGGLMEDRPAENFDKDLLV